MNIFHTHHDPYVAARHLCDKHIPKMLLETMQMLCTTHHRYGNAPPPLYRAAYQHHPMTIWVGDKLGNYLWTLEHGLALAKEYTFRFGKRHASEALFPWLPNAADIPRGAMTAPPMCMPDQYKDLDHNIAYRNYYIGEKAHFAKWEKGRPAPDWFTNARLS